MLCVCVYIISFGLLFFPSPLSEAVVFVFFCFISPRHCIKILLEFELCAFPPLESLVVSVTYYVIYPQHPKDTDLFSVLENEEEGKVCLVYKAEWIWQIWKSIMVISGYK